MRSQGFPTKIRYRLTSKPSRVEHQGLECLDPFSIGVFFELDVLPLCEVELVSSKAVVDLYDDETIADDYTNCCEQNGVVVRADTADNPYSSGHSQNYNNGCQDCDYERCCENSSLTVPISIMRR